MVSEKKFAYFSFDRGESFFLSSKQSYKRHHKTQHEGEKRKEISCYFCNWAGSESVRAFSVFAEPSLPTEALVSEQSLSSHLTFHHMPKEGRDPCQHCNFNWTWEGNPSAPKLVNCFLHRLGIANNIISWAIRLIDHTELCPCADETGTWEWDRDYELFVRKVRESLFVDSMPPSLTDALYRVLSSENIYGRSKEREGCQGT